MYRFWRIKARKARLRFSDAVKKRSLLEYSLSLFASCMCYIAFRLFIIHRITSAINKEKITNPADIPRPTLRIGNVMFSLNPCDPGIEQSVSALNQMIFGQEGHIIPLSIIAKLDIFGSTILCKCYSAVDGITLKDLFTKAPELVPYVSCLSQNLTLFSYLDHENLSIHYLSSILSRPAKQNMTDLIVSPLVALYEGKEEKRLMLYANPGTVYFCDEFSKKMPSHRGRDGVTSTVSSMRLLVILCRDLFTKLCCELPFGCYHRQKRTGTNLWSHPRFIQRLVNSINFVDALIGRGKIGFTHTRRDRLAFLLELCFSKRWCQSPLRSRYYLVSSRTHIIRNSFSAGVVHRKYRWCFVAFSR